MKKRGALIVILCALTAFGLWGLYTAQWGAEFATRQNVQFTIGVLIKSMSHQHWMDVRSGVLKAADELDVATVILYPESESAIDEQKAMFVDLVQMKPDLILFAPNDSDNCRKYVEMAQRAGITVLALDTRTNDVQTPFIGADNHLIGELAARRLAALTNGEGDVAIIAGKAEQASHQERIQGFVEALNTQPGMSLVDVRYANSDFNLAMESMTQIARVHPTLSGVFCTSAVMGLGAIEQKKSGNYDVLPFVVAVDTQDDALIALKNGLLDGLITQDGFEAGYKAVYVAVDCLKGREIAQNTYIETELLTRDKVEGFLLNRSGRDRDDSGVAR